MKFLKSESVHGAVGVTVGVGGLALAQHINAWLQTVSLLITILIGAATLVSVGPKAVAKAREWWRKGAGR